VQAEGRGARGAAALAALGLAALLLEVGLARTLAFAWRPEAVPLLVALASLGAGPGALAAARGGGLAGGRAAALALAAVGALAAGGLWLAHGAAASASGGRAAALALALPFAAAWAALGALVAALLARAPEQLPSRHAAQRVGLAAGALAAAPLLDALGAPACLALAGAALAAAGALAAARGWPALAAAAVALALAGLALRPAWLPEPAPDPASKDLDPAQPHSFSRWGALARVDVVEPPARPELRLQLVLRDAQWSSALDRFDGDLAAWAQRPPDALALPYWLGAAPPGRVAVLAGGGTREILEALARGAREVVAVEEGGNAAALLAAAFTDLGDAEGRHPRVTVLRAGVRRFLAGAREDFDVIQLAAPAQPAAPSAALASALVAPEAFLHTSEALAQMLARLAPDGVLCAHFGEPDWEAGPLRTARFLASAREAFRRLGVADASRHVVVATSPGFGLVASVLLRRAPLTDLELEAFLGRLPALPGVAVRYAAGRVFEHGLLAELLSRPAPARGAAALAALSDDAPFLAPRRPLADALRAAAGGGLLLPALGLAGLLALGLALHPPAAARGGAPRRGAGLFCLTLGLASALCLAGLAQRLAPALGDPGAALGIALPAFYACAAAGSAAAPWLARGRGGLLALGALPGLGALALVCGLGARPEVLLAAPGPLRLLAAVGAAAPFGLALGALFPLGLRAAARAAQSAPARVAWCQGVVAAGAGTGVLLAGPVALAGGLGAVVSAGALLAAGAAALLVRLAPRSGPEPGARAGAVHRASGPADTGRASP
jgi:hypothetical protein